MRLSIGIVALIIGLATVDVQAKPEAFEIGKHNVSELPKGKEADGIIGDFILRNDMVTALISSNKPMRKANMGTMWNAVTPGCLYDLTYNGEDNDQLVVFMPCNQQGPVSYVRIVDDGSTSDAAEIEVVVSAASNGGLSKRHLYRIRDGWKGIAVITTLINESEETQTFTTNDSWTRLSDVELTNGIFSADAVDPADKVGYAFGWLEVGGYEAPDTNLEIEPGKEVTFARAFSIGRSPAQAWGLVHSVNHSFGTLQATIKDNGGKPVPTAAVKVPIGEQVLHAYPNNEGEFELRLPPGEYKLSSFDHGRGTVETTVTVRDGQTSDLDIQMKKASRVSFNITTAERKDSPCKVQFIGINGTETPYLGPDNRAHGCLDQYHSETGKFEVKLEPGDYKIIVTRGIEYDHIEKEIKLGEGKDVNIKGKLTRVVQTPGWVSADFHNHSTPSGDNTCGTYDRIINIAAEHLEFNPTTEHNRLFDWTPYIKELGLDDEMTTVPGMELTGGNHHFNTFPLTPSPYEQDGGAPQWQYDPRLNAINLRSYQEFVPERWIQVNHPDLIRVFNDENRDGIPDGGYQGFENMIDGAEIVNKGGSRAKVHILGKSPVYFSYDVDGSPRVQFNREYLWLQLLNMGHRYASVAVADAHRVHGNGVGGWRIFLPSSTDDPSKIDWKEMSRNAKAGRIIISNGPFLEVKTDDGLTAGGMTLANSSIDLHVKVQCNSWVNIDRIQVLVNSAQREDVNFTKESHPDMFKDGTVQFDETINVKLQEDSHLIVVAFGENYDLKTGWGTSWESNMNPCAYNNPIYVDVDGGGFKANGDTLGYPFPTSKLSVEEAEEWIARSN